jgi:hypothetical protein
MASTFGLGPPKHAGHEFSFITKPPHAAVPTGLIQYHFAALGGDTLSQSVMGNRHRRGLHVPVSCEASLLYLQPAAEAAADAAATPRGLPMVLHHSRALLYLVDICETHLL